MAKICNNCGASTNDETVFCPSCGKPVTAGKNNGKADFQNTAQNINDAFKKFNDTEDLTGDFDPNDIAMNKGMAVLSYIGFLFLVPMLAASNSKYAKFHVNQGIALFIVDIIYGIVLGIVSGILGAIPFIGWIFGAVLGLLGIIPFVFMIMGILNAATGKAKELPFIGKLKIITK